MADTRYKTFQIWIKKGHRLHPYLEESCQRAKNLYNTTNFYFRQIYTAFRQHKPLQPLQKEVLDILNQNIDIMNEQHCRAKDGRYLKFPKTKQRLNIGRLGVTNGTLRQVRVVP